MVDLHRKASERTETFASALDSDEIGQCQPVSARITHSPSYPDIPFPLYRTEINPDDQEEGITDNGVDSSPVLAGRPKDDERPISPIEAPNAAVASTWRHSIDCSPIRRKDIRGEHHDHSSAINGRGGFDERLGSLPPGRRAGARGAVNMQTAAHGIPHRANAQLPTPGSPPSHAHTGAPTQPPLDRPKRDKTVITCVTDRPGCRRDPVHNRDNLTIRNPPEVDPPPPPPSLVFTESANSQRLFRHDFGVRLPPLPPTLPPPPPPPVTRPDHTQKVLFNLRIKGQDPGIFVVETSALKLSELTLKAYKHVHHLWKDLGCSNYQLVCHSVRINGRHYVLRRHIEDLSDMPNIRDDVPLLVFDVVPISSG